MRRRLLSISVRLSPPTRIPAAWPQIVQLLVDLDVVAHLGENFARISRKGIGLHIDLVRQPLMVDARRVDGFLDIHAVIDDIDDRFERDRDDARAAGAADDHERLAILGNDRRAHGRKRRLLRLDGIGFSLHQPVEIGEHPAWR